GFGAELSQVLWLRPKEEERKVWALEQVVRSGLFPLVIASGVRISERAGRRLQLASEKSETVVLTLNSKPSLAWVFALQCEVRRKGKEVLLINVLKSRRSIQGRECEVNLYESEDDRSLFSKPALVRAAS